jgi:hypothetical protein
MRFSVGKYEASTLRRCETNCIVDCEFCPTLYTQSLWLERIGDSMSYRIYYPFQACAEAGDYLDDVYS